MKKLSALILLLFIGHIAMAQDTTRVRKSTTVDSTSVKTTPAQPQQPVDAKPNKKSGEFYGGGFYLGARAMPIFSDIDISRTRSGALETELVVGYGFGGLLGVNFDNHWGLQLEGMYSSIAQRFRETGITREVRLSYFHIPIMAVYNTGFDKSVNLNITAGPQLGINTGSQVNTLGESKEADTVKVVLAVKPGDLGFAYGAGLDFGFGEKKLSKFSLGYRGVVGLVDISSGSRNTTTTDLYILERSRIRTYALYAGLTFGF